LSQFWRWRPPRGMAGSSACGLRPPSLRSRSLSRPGELPEDTDRARPSEFIRMRNPIRQGWYRPGLGIFRPGWVRPSRPRSPLAARYCERIHSRNRFALRPDLATPSLHESSKWPADANGLRAGRSNYEPASPVAAGTVAVELRQGEDRHSTPEPGSEHVGWPVSSRVDALNAHQNDQR